MDGLLKANEILANLTNWNFDVFPTYKMGEAESQKLVSILEEYVQIKAENDTERGENR